MTSAEAFLTLDSAGFTLGVKDGHLCISPATSLTTELRALATSHKHELLVLAREAERAATELIEAAVQRRRCASTGRQGRSV